MDITWLYIDETWSMLYYFFQSLTSLVLKLGNFQDVCHVNIEDKLQCNGQASAGHTQASPPGPDRNSDASLFRRLNGPKYFPLDRHATRPTVQCSENGTHWSEGPFV